MDKPDRPYRKKSFGDKPPGRRPSAPKGNDKPGYRKGGPPKDGEKRPSTNRDGDRKPYARKEGASNDNERNRKPYPRKGGTDKPGYRKAGPPSEQRRKPYERRDSRPPNRSAKRLLDDVLKEDGPKRRPMRNDQGRREREDGPPKERLHKYLARCGVASRRAAEIMITEGRVELNGELVTEMGVLVDPENDRVKVDGNSIRPEKPYYVLLNKPKGVITTLSDPRRRPTITQYLPDLGVMLRPVGRLDMDSSGLLVCTNDGNLADRLTHPSFGVEKEYDVIVRGEVGERSLKRLRNGVYIQGKWTAEAYVEIVGYEKRSDTTKLRMIIHEGRNRQIRLMCDSVGNPVEELQRVRIGPLKIRGLRSGEARLIGVQEVEELWGASGIQGKKDWFENRVRSIREKRPPKPQEGEGENESPRTRGRRDSNAASSDSEDQ